MAAVVFRLSQILPPTPPRVTTHATEHARRFLEDQYDLDRPHAASKHQQQGNVTLDTPPQSSPQHSDAGNSKQTKEVKFLPHPFPDDRPSSLRRIPSSKSLKSSRSILKLHTPSPSYDSTKDPFFCTEASSKPPQTFAEMLQSVVQMLAGTDLTSRLDSYQVLLRSLRAHEQLPDRKALRDKLPLFEGFIRRDISAKKEETSSKALCLSALKLAIILMEVYTAGTFDQTFLTFLFDYTTSMMKQEHPSKDLALHSMQLLAVPHLVVKCSQLDRLQELLKDLETISDRISGMNVYRLRLMIYQRLVHRSGTLMIDNTGRWLPQVFHGMLSDNGDLRSRAVEAAMSAGVALGTSKAFSQCVAGLLHQEGSDNIKYLDHFEKRLGRLLANPEEHQSVPRIWAAVMLLLRGSLTVTEKWLCSTGWLKLLQKCFNSSNSKLQLDALLAWDKTIFAFGAALSTKVSVLKTLRTPIIGLLQRQMPAKLKTHVLSTYCTLLYYAFAPTTTSENLTHSWRILVHDIVLQLLQKASSEAQPVARILTAMFSDSEVKVWNSERALDTGISPLKPNEVPRLDSTWVRKNIGIISQVVTPLLAVIESSTNALEPYSTRLWSSLLTNLSEAGSKEVMISADAKKAYAELINVLYRLRSSSFAVKEVDQIQSAEFLVILAQDMVAILPAVHLTENILLRTESGAFEPINTPTRNVSARLHRCQSPLIAFLELLLAVCGSCRPSEGLQNGLQNIMLSCLNTKASPKLKLALLEESTRVLATAPRRTGTSLLGNSDAAMTLYESIMHCLLDLSYSSVNGAISASTEQASHAGDEITSTVQVLQTALRFSDDRSLELGKQLYNTVRGYARNVAGDSAVLVAVNEPIINFINTNMSDLSLSAILSFTQGIISDGVTITGQKVLEHARKALWDRPPSALDLSGLSWLKILYTTVGNALSLSYMQYDTVSEQIAQEFLTTLNKFLRIATQSLRGTIPGPELFFWHMYDGLCIWAEDVDGKVFPKNSCRKELQITIQTLWSSVMIVISRLPLKNNAQLRVVEPLFCAGFQSRSRAVANASITTWNQTFGAEQTLEYPKDLLFVLDGLRHHADLSLPVFPIAEPDEQQLNDVERRMEADDKALFPWLSSNEESQLELIQTSTPSKPPTSIGQIRDARIFGPRQRPTNPLTHQERAPNKQTTPARLRHEDSQIEFVAIVSSPVDSQDAESQFLTDRQMEVRRRQQVDGALFKELRSSASPSTPVRGKISEHNQGIAETSSRHLETPIEEMHLDDESPNNNDELPAIVDSSPIERARKGRSPYLASNLVTPVRPVTLSVVEEEDIPSSPPDITVEDIFNRRLKRASELQSFQSNRSLEAGGNAGGSVGSNLSPNASKEFARSTEASRHEPTGLEDFTSDSNEIMAHLAAEEDEIPGDTSGQSPIPSGASLSPAQKLLQLAQKSPTTETVLITDSLLVPRTMENQTSQVLLSQETRIVAEDSTVPEKENTSQFEGLRDSDAGIGDAAVVDEAFATEQPSDVQSLPSSQRMVAAYVSVPSRHSDQTYEDLSNLTGSTKKQSEAEVLGTLRMRKRKVDRVSSGSISKKARTVNSEERIIRCRESSVTSPSLRELAIQSSIFVGSVSGVLDTPDRTSRKTITSAESRKRSSPTSSEDNTEDTASATVMPPAKRSTKRAKIVSADQHSPNSKTEELVRRRNSKRRIVSPKALLSTPVKRSQRLTNTRSSLSLASPDFQQDNMISEITPSAAAPASEEAADLSFWSDATGDVIENVVLTDYTNKQRGVEERDVGVAHIDTRVLKSAPNDAEPLETDTNIVPDSSFEATQPETGLVLSEPVETSLPRSLDISAPHGHAQDLLPIVVTDPLAPVETPTDVESQIRVATKSLSFQVALPQQQATRPTTPPIPLSPTTLARNIIGRLRGLLADCKSLVLGSPGEGRGELEEAEELQDLAHELQGELLKARRRGKSEA